jgi:hypothetical protein
VTNYYETYWHPFQHRKEAVNLQKKEKWNVSNVLSKIIKAKNFEVLPSKFRPFRVSRKPSTYKKKEKWNVSNVSSKIIKTKKFRSFTFKIYLETARTLQKNLKIKKIKKIRTLINVLIKELKKCIKTLINVLMKEFKKIETFFNIW